MLNVATARQQTVSTPFVLQGIGRASLPKLLR